jgi:hypothetical protein
MAQMGTKTILACESFYKKDKKGRNGSRWDEKMTGEQAFLYRKLNNAKKGNNLKTMEHF